ncbi:MAG: ComEC/Rec2 family competence protein [Bacteroidota bacterium]
MLYWAQYAVVRVVAFFMLGILFAVYIPFHTSIRQIWWFSLGSVISYLVLSAVLKKATFVKYNLLLSVGSSFVFATLGYLCLVCANQTTFSDHISNFQNVEAYTFVVTDAGEEKAKTTRYLAQISAVKDSLWYSATGKMYLYVSKDLPGLDYGSTYLIGGQLQRLSGPMNPGEFDYQRFLSYQNIHYQQFVREPPLLIKARPPSFTISSFGLEMSNWAKAVFEKNIKHEQERGIALALVLGIKDGLNNEIKNAYSASGAMHVLAVSGLHVGIIYLILSALLGRLQSGTVGRWIFALLVLSVLWIYALITGFSPSVLRAVTMFSFVIVARAINRKSNIYNTLAASALILLFFNPYLIMSVGFQLSYLAVFGIVFLQPRIYDLLHFDTILIDKVWEITAVSIAAQLATFPLGLLYFHQFPTYFLLSNLVVIPGAFALLILGILLLLFSWAPMLAALIGSVLEAVVSVVNRVVFWIEGMPIGRIDDVYITVIESGFIMLLTLSIAILFVTRRVKVMYAIFSFSLLLCISLLIRSIHNGQLNRLIFYRINGHTAVEWISNERSVLWSDDQLLHDSEKLYFNVRPNRLKCGVHKTTAYPFKRLDTGIDIAMVAKKSILVLRDIHKETNFGKKPRVNFLIYSGDCRRSLKWVVERFDFDLLILGGDLSVWKAEKLRGQSAELGLSFYSIYHEGALEYEI